MKRLFITAALLSMLVGSCSAPKHLDVPQTETTVPESSTESSAEISETPEIEEFSALPDPPAPDLAETAAPEAVAEPEPATPAEPEEGLTNPPAPGMEDAATAGDAAETGTVPAMPDGLEVPPMPDLNE